MEKKGVENECDINLLKATVHIFFSAFSHFKLTLCLPTVYTTVWELFYQNVPEFKSSYCICEWIAKSLSMKQQDSSKVSRHAFENN